ncbi:MAG: lipopolysaccharide biosynthesis protein RfbH [Candidatus Micrarchaeia archaeon]
MTKETIRREIHKLVSQYCELSKNEFVAGKTKVHYAGRVFDEKEVNALVESALDFWLTLGPCGEEFEKNFCKMLETKHSLLVNSGSSANLVAVTSLCSAKLGKRALKPSSEAITPSCTFPTTLSPLLANSIKPVLVDSQLGNYNLDLDATERAISDKTRLLIFPHTLGNPVDMKRVMEIAQEHDLLVIEDACDALGSTFNNKAVGTFADFGTFSFYPAHHITLGEGGAVVTDESLLDGIATSVRDWGRACFCKGNADKSGACKKRLEYKVDGIQYDHRYIYDNMGYNLKPTDLQAAIGVEQLKKFPKFKQKRWENFKFLYDVFAQYSEKFILPESVDNAQPCWFAFPLTIKDNAGFSRREFTMHLEENLIETRLLFAGNIARQPAYRQRGLKVAGSLKNSDKIMSDTFFIGVYPGLSKAHLEYVESKVRKFFEGKRA